MNTTTLNMTTLDGGVIIKEGGGATPTPPSSGGEVLEGEYYLAKPNGWYWKLTDKLSTGTVEFQYQAITACFLMFSTVYEVVKGDLNLIYKSGILTAYRDIGSLQTIAVDGLNATPSTSLWIAIAEGGNTKIDFGEMQGEYNSLYEVICALAMPMTETEFEAMMLAEYGLQRITKEEYEALITA